MKIGISDDLLKAEFIKYFESGNTSKQNLWELFKDKYKVQTQRFFAIFAEAYIYWTEVKNKALDDAIRDNTFKGLENSYISKIEALNILSDIARGKVVIYEDNVLVPSFSDRRAAIDSVCKIEGWYASTKLDAQINTNQTQAVLVINTNEVLITNEDDLTDE